MGNPWATDRAHMVGFAAWLSCVAHAATLIVERDGQPVHNRSTVLAVRGGESDNLLLTMLALLGAGAFALRRRPRL